MKILIKSIYLFLFGLYVEAYKKHFDSVMDRYIEKGHDISCIRLTKMSNKSYQLYVDFKEYEKSLKYDILLKNIIKNTI
ncbi:MAG: hypothetical protein IJX57_04870 [Clostridia bacterium]|nr:hypothetical protein [Clostridia bacterium]